jgi:hypothetical protein
MEAPKIRIFIVTSGHDLSIELDPERPGLRS